VYVLGLFRSSAPELAEAELKVLCPCILSPIAVAVAYRWEVREVKTLLETAPFERESLREI